MVSCVAVFIIIDIIAMLAMSRLCDDAQIVKFKAT